MYISPINQTQKSFGMNFKLSKETIKSIERTTGLTSEEITTSHIDECEKLMIERGKLKKPNKLFVWLQDKYQKFGEKTGLLKKEPYLYTELD